MIDERLFLRLRELRQLQQRCQIITSRVPGEYANAQGTIISEGSKRDGSSVWLETDEPVLQTFVRHDEIVDVKAL